MSAHVPSVLRRALMLCMAIIVFLISLAVLIFLSTYLIIQMYFDGTATLPVDCALVFGAAVAGYDTPGPAIVRRVSTAAMLYHNGQVRRLIFSGGVGKGSGVSESEADVMRTLAVQLGVHPADIALESQSHSTWQNLLYARNLTESCDSVAGISDAFHLARIELLSWRQGWGELGTVPAEDRPPLVSERQSMIREVFAMLYYAFYLDRFLPGLQQQY